MRLRLLVPCFAACGALTIAAEPEPASKPERLASAETLPPIFAPRAPSADLKSTSATRGRSAAVEPPTRRAISPEMAAKLSSIATQAAPPPRVAAGDGSATSTTSVDSSGAVQLKPYIVREDRVPEFKQRDMLTDKGKIALARQRYPGLAFTSDAAALSWMQEQFALERRKEAADLKGLLEIGTSKPPPDVKRKIDETLMQPSELTFRIGEPFRQPR